MAPLFRRTLTLNRLCRHRRTARNDMLIGNNFESEKDAIKLIFNSQMNPIKSGYAFIVQKHCGTTLSWQHLSYQPMSSVKITDFSLSGHMTAIMIITDSGT